MPLSLPSNYILESLNECLSVRDFEINADATSRCWAYDLYSHLLGPILHPSEALLLIQYELVRRCRWWCRASACRVGCRIIPNDHNMSTTFAKAIKSHVNRHGNLLACYNAGSNIQNLVGVCKASQSIGRRQAARRMCTSPVSPCQKIRSLAARHAIGNASLQSRKEWAGGWEPVDFDQTIRGSISCPQRLTSLYKRCLCHLLSTYLPARGFTISLLSARTSATRIDH